MIAYTFRTIWGHHHRPELVGVVVGAFVLDKLETWWKRRRNAQATGRD